MESYKEILKSIEQAELHFEEGAIRDGQKLVNKIRNSFKNLEKTPNKLRHKFNFILAQSRYFDDVSSYAANPKRDELIEEAKQLIKSNESIAPRKQADKIHALQGKWQLLDQSSKPASRNQWETFRKLIDKAWEPCAEFFDELNEVKKNNAVKRQELIEEIKRFATKANNKDSIQYLSKFLKNAFNQWQTFSPVSDADFKQLKQEFALARKPIFDLIKSIETANKQLKESLIQSVIDFSEAENSAGMQFFKDAKIKFKSIGPAGFKNEQFLWDEFNKAGDKFFEEEKALQNEQITQINQVLKDINIDSKESIENAAKVLSGSQNAKKSKEYSELKQIIGDIRQSQKLQDLSQSIENLKGALTPPGIESAQQLNFDNRILSAIKNSSYRDDQEKLKKLVAEIEMEAGIELSKSDEKYKQQIMLERLQSKFRTNPATIDRPTEIIIEFIHNASRKASATQTKLWHRCCDALLVITSQNR